MIKIHKGALPKTKASVGLREDFVDFNEVQVKSEPIEQNANDDDPLLLDGSAITIKEEPSIKQFYGRIALKVGDNGAHVYQLICDKCTKSFPNLEKFDEHISNNYLTTSTEQVVHARNDVNAEGDKIKNEIGENREVHDKQQPPSTSTTKVTSIEHQASNECELLDFSASESEDDTYVPPARKLKPSQKNNTSNNKKRDANKSNLHDLSVSDNGDKTYTPAAKKLKTPGVRSVTLSFDYPDKACFTFFLELLRTHAILWLKRQCTNKPFTIAATTLINEFNAKYTDYNLNKRKLQLAINGIKKTYESSSSSKNNDKESKEQTTDFNTKYAEFLKICAEIDENSKQIEKKCEHCIAVFYCPIELQIHKFKNHKIGELPYKCKRCGYGFAASDTLAKHEETHNRVKSFECDICGYSCYTESRLLAHHTNMHTGDRKAICEICGLVCPDASRLYQHKRSHEEKKEKCSICEKSFLEKWQLKDHMKAHQNLQSYICNLCGKGYNRQKNLYIHRRCVHKIKSSRQPTTYSKWGETEISQANVTNSDEESDDDEDTKSEQATNHSKEVERAKTQRDPQLWPLNVLNNMFS